MTYDEIITLWRKHQEVNSFAREVETIIRGECAAMLEDNARHCVNPIIRGVLQANATEMRESRKAEAAK
jgi:hypothetical protein